jgi:NAD-dependent deacetylase
LQVRAATCYGTRVGQPRIDDDCQQLIAAIAEERGLIVALTGAGISLASGIPTFRGTDPGAIWSRDITELATLDYFTSDPVGSWRWYRKRFLGVLAAHPNPAHRALVDLERWQASRRGDFLLVTQNIDTLHEQAGSTRLAKVHGSADRCRCSDSSCRLGALDSLLLDDVDFTEFDRDPRVDTIPSCPSCGAPVRPHVLWFDEYYTSHAEYQWHFVDAAARRVRLLLCVGTSLAVGVTSFLQSAAANAGAPVFIVDPGERPREAHHSSIHLRAKAEELLPETCRALSALPGKLP